MKPSCHSEGGLNMIRLVPQNGARVRDPKSKLIVGPEGVEIQKINTFWFRRIQDGSMVEAVEKPAAKISKIKEEK